MLIFNRTQDCHHIFCLPCLREHFEKCLCCQLQYCELPDDLAALKTPPYAPATIETFFTREIIFVLLYHCPSCNAAVWEKLKEIRPLMRIIDVLTTAIGAPANPAETTDRDDVWTGIFPAYGY
jgi:hypothetical protein